MSWYTSRSVSMKVLIWLVLLFIVITTLLFVLQSNLGPVQIERADASTGEVVESSADNTDVFDCCWKTTSTSGDYGTFWDTFDAPAEAGDNLVDTVNGSRSGDGSYWNEKSLLVTPYTYDAAKNENCRTARWILKRDIVSPWGYLWQTEKQKFCWHNGVVQDVGGASADCGYNGVVPTDWKCRGVTESSSSFFRWRQNSHGGHRAGKVVKWQECVPTPLGSACIDTMHQGMTLVLHGNGTDRFKAEY